MSVWPAIPLAAAAFVAACAPPPSATPLPTAVAPTDTVAVLAFGPDFRDARAIGVDPHGRIYVSDAGGDVVHRIHPDGEAAPSLGGSGSGDHAFLTPSGLDPTNGLVLFVADRDNGRVQRFSHEDRLLESIPVPADPGPLLGRRTDGAGRGRPTAVAAAPTGEIFVIEDGRGVVLMWDNRRSLQRLIGDAGDGRGALRQPVDLAITPDGHLLVADAGHAAILVYDAYGQFLRRLADGLAAGVQAVSADYDRIAVILPDRVLLYSHDGMLEKTYVVLTRDPVVGGALANGGIVLLTRTGAWRLPDRALQ